MGITDRDVIETDTSTQQHSNYGQNDINALDEDIIPLNANTNKEHRSGHQSQGNSMKERNALRSGGITEDGASSDIEDATSTMSVANFFMAALLFTVIIVFAAYIPRKSHDVIESKKEDTKSETEETPISYQSDYVSFGIYE